MKKILILVGMVLLVATFASAVNQVIRAEVVPGKLNVYSPFENEVYDSRMIPLNVSMNGFAKKFRYGYIDNGGRFVTLCRSCFEYGFHRLKRKPFDEGYHELTLLGIFDTGEVSRTVHFTIDSKDPKIRKTSPRNGINNGRFEVRFQEANPVDLKLHLEEEVFGIDIGESCETKDSLNYDCSFSVDLSEYNGDEVEYYFELEDILGHVDESRPREFLVDTKDPIIEFMDYVVDNRRVEFAFHIDEDNFDKLVYRDLKSENPRDRRVCSRLVNDGNCLKKISFSRGEHELVFEVFDDAGNSVISDSVEFEIA